MTAAKTRPAPVAVVGAGPATSLLTRHLLDHSVDVVTRRIRPGMPRPDLTAHRLVLMLYARSVIADRLWPLVLDTTAPGTTLLHLGPHRLEGARRCYLTAAAMDVRVVHAPLTWTPHLDQLYLSPRSRQVLAVHRRRAAPGTAHHTVLDALASLRRADTRAVLGPPEDGRRLRARPHTG